MAQRPAYPAKVKWSRQKVILYQNRELNIKPHILRQIGRRRLFTAAFHLNLYNLLSCFFQMQWARFMWEFKAMRMSVRCVATAMDWNRTKFAPPFRRRSLLTQVSLAMLRSRYAWICFKRNCAKILCNWSRNEAVVVFVSHTWDRRIYSWKTLKRLAKRVVSVLFINA